jgi:hypothetical protein
MIDKSVNTSPHPIGENVEDKGETSAVTLDTLRRYRDLPEDS